MAKIKVELPYRIKVRAPHGHSSTNGICYRYFETFDEAAHFVGRIGYPEVEYGAAFKYRENAK